LDFAKRTLQENEKADASKLKDLYEIVDILTEKHNASESKRESLVQVLIKREEQEKNAQRT
jgi:hypothetical protein